MSDAFSQPGSARTDIYHELASLRLIDPHTHINPHAAASTTLADLLGYHYYTELAHSAGMPKSQIESGSIGPKELVERLVGRLGPLENTVQYSWLIEICQMFFGFEDDRLHAGNWESLYDRSESIMAAAQWPDMVLDQSNIEAVFLTNDFDDDLEGFDSDRYIPCLRTDDLVFHLADRHVRERLAACTGVELDGTLESLRASLRVLFEHFVGRGARACAISLPPSFTPSFVPDGRAKTALDAVLRGGLASDPSHREALSRRVFWTLAELCDEFQLPFDLMIGVNRKVYVGGVFQGQDLFDSRVSLIQYRELFNTFADVKFPVSVLASVTNQELVSYAWIFPNVIPNGHWWYSNTPSTITHDLAARLEAVPQNKLIGYYSDAYKLEFVWPKFNMYRKVLAGVLADQFVRDRGWSIERAVELGRTVLKDNTEAIFPKRVIDPADSARSTSPMTDTALEIPSLAPESSTRHEQTTDPAESLAAESLVAEDWGTDDESELVVDLEDGPSDQVDAGAMEDSIDPVPMDDEIDELDLDDVELVDPDERPVHDAVSMESAIDDVALDVGDLTSADASSDEEDSEQPASQIKQLRGETSFSPDDESLQLKPDPMTGEYRFDSGPSDGDESEDQVVAEDVKPDEGDLGEFDLNWLEEDDQDKEK